MQRRQVLASIAGGVTLAAMPVGATGERLHVPGEEKRHAATFMQWPVSRKVYRDRLFLDMTQQTIAAFEPVIMLADKGDHDAARRMLSDKVELWNVPTEDL